METVINISTGEFEYPDPDPDEGYEDISDDAKGFINSLLVSSSGLGIINHSVRLSMIGNIIFVVVVVVFCRQSIY